MSSLLDEEKSETLVRTCRTALGETLRSVVFFTPSEYELLYLRQDLYDDEVDARPVKEFLIESERPLFGAGPEYSDLSQEHGSEPEIGEFEFTIRVFSEGYVVPVVTGDRGIIVTTDSTDIDSFEEFGVAVEQLLEHLDEIGAETE